MKFVQKNPRLLKNGIKPMNSTSVFHFFIGVSVEQQMNYAESADINSVSIGNYVLSEYHIVV